MGTGTETTAPTRGTERERDTESGTGVHGTERGSTTGSGAGAETERSIENTTRIGTDTETEKEKEIEEKLKEREIQDHQKPELRKSRGEKKREIRKEDKIGLITELNRKKNVHYLIFIFNLLKCFEYHENLKVGFTL